MSGLLAVTRRELAAYFATPVAAVFLVVFLLLAGTFAFTLGDLFGRGVADLQPFFAFVPWLLLFLVPALTMRLWAEERRSGTIELLLTLPLHLWQAVLGKFLAAWLFCGLALLLTFPLVLTVNWLGQPDNGAIAAGYLGCWLLSAAYLAVGGTMSALTRNQVVAFVLAVSACFLFAAAGTPVVTEFLSRNLPVLAETARALSLTERLAEFTRGVVAAPDVIFLASFVAVWLLANAVAVEWRKAD